MYEAFYGFQDKPFGLAPDPAYLFLSKKHRRALVMLQYGLINQVGFSVVTGEIGSGKTTLVRKLIHRTDTNTSVGLVSNTQCDSFEELLQWILLSFELEYRDKSKVDLYHTLTDFLVEQHKGRRRSVLIIDEAQNLTMESLEQLRMLSNVNADHYQLLQLVLVGQPELLEVLRRPELVQFAQRIGADYHLGPLDLHETGAYIVHRLRIAGGSTDTFAPETYEPIWRATRGVPRLINLISDMALVYGYAEQRKPIDAGLIKEVIRDKRGGISPIGSPDEPSGGGALRQANRNG